MSLPSRLAQARQTVRTALLAQRQPAGYWEGRLSSSALATATAVTALHLGGEARDGWLVRRGLHWLRATQRADGGFGDTPDSPSNLATSLLVLATCELTADTGADLQASRQRLGEYVKQVAGEGPEAIVRAVRQAYGHDRTFAVPILMHCALAGLVPWSAVPGLPFELAALPPQWYRRVRLQVVSYALPALIAVGLLLHQRHPPSGPLRAVRRLVKERVLRQLAALQPASGGYLEAAPLTAFVVMSLQAAGGLAPEVVAQALGFLRASIRSDGSWPIDTNLSIWVTSNACQALQAAGGLSPGEARVTFEWLQARQLQVPHPFTGAAPGGWGWSHLPGSVPDGDDTAGALLVLADQAPPAVLEAGVQWLLGLQNSDGGWPTFCRGWGKLPFDQSCADLTAHALRALQACQLRLPPRRRIDQAIRRGRRYLQRVQAADGSWRPLWFGSQLTADQSNPVFGTARVLPALARHDPTGKAAQRGLEYLWATQHQSGGWGAAAGVSPSLEETALAVTALTHWPAQRSAALLQGVEYLLQRVESGCHTRPQPVGLYFARLWYAEALYPLTWTLEALGRASCLHL